MNWTLTVLLGVASVNASPIPNLDFSTGKLTSWEGNGFTVTSASVTSADQQGRPQKALLHRTLTLPSTARYLQFQAAALRPAGIEPGDPLDVILEGAKRTYLPREVRQGNRWEPAPTLLGQDGSRLREYRFRLEGHAGRKVRIALVDSDERPGCSLTVSGFQIVTQDDLEARRFAQYMRKLQQEHGLGTFSRYDSRHFLALSNAELGYSEYRLRNCETLHGFFFDHFRKRGFPVVVPVEKLMVAIFATEGGFEAYLGQKSGSAVTGLYHPPTNRLVIYDYASNRGFLAGKKRLEELAKDGTTDLDRQHRTVRVGQFVRDQRDDTNISTVMHEAAHQLSFNCGMLNREGDVPVWLAEGLAVYCEATNKTVWQGIGEPNPGRAAVLRRVLKDKGELLALRQLVVNDNWIRKARLVEDVVLGYSQSWALFRLMMEEHPRQLRTYLQTVYPRKTPEHRLADFQAAFGDLGKFERRYREYLAELARKEGGK